MKIFNTITDSFFHDVEKKLKTKKKLKIEAETQRILLKAYFAGLPFNKSFSNKVFSFEHISGHIITSHSVNKQFNNFS